MKRLVVCCDGTWNTPEMESPTNVVRMAQAVSPRGTDGCLQLVYYDEGVGTAGWMDRIAGGAMGEGLDLNVRQAYRFLANNHEAGDEIYLFGFSRGAYTARSLAGLIGYAGMLGRHQLTHFAQAYELYRSEKEANGVAAKAFRAEHGTRVPEITLLGCWDTVGALGIPDKLPGIGLDRRFNRRYRWIDGQLGPHVANALHAVAIDERRREFAPTRMRRGREGQNLEEVWFPGDHGSVGGGTKHKEPLARFALEWMAEGIARHGLGLSVDTAFPGLAARDHNAYFSRDRNPIYGRRRRGLGDAPVFHASAIARFMDLPDYGEDLGGEQRGLLDAAAREVGTLGSLGLLPRRTALEPRGRAQAIVHAERHRNDTFVRMVAGARYRLWAEPTQCWRDGDLPPCDARGWHMDDEALGTHFRRLSRMKRPLINLGRSRRVLPDANWLELVGILRAADGREAPFRIGLKAEFDAPFDGHLLAFANDIQSRIDLMDSYDDNEGWLLLNIERMA
ncbi:MAG: DUF2235 domain-containing protein [Gammaproteobacteria bacterium]|nr:DUF2235 domain-containing protein [Gammaproteobacteria bacterium]